MKPVGALLVAAFLAVAATAAAQRESVPPPPTPVQGQALLSDVQTSYARMEQNIEQQYAKLIQEAKNNKQKLEDQIKSLQNQITKLKETAKKIQLVMQKLQELLPKVVGAVGSDPHGGKGRTTSAGQRDSLEALLRVELARAGRNMSPEELRKLADEITKGGQGAMGLALQIVISIAGADRDNTPARPDFPKVTGEDVSNAAPLRGPAAAAFFSGRFSKQAQERLAEIDKAIDSALAGIQSRKEQIAALENEIEKLRKDKEKALADLRAQRLKALETATKARDASLVRTPTPTASPKKP
jgi:septal ring factor EnvC (AmiA/AmiB activator)